MPNYVRVFRPGGTFFLTLVTEHRAPVFADPRARSILHQAIASCGRHHPFTLEAVVCLPDHLHLLMTLPEGDADFSARVTSLKIAFTRTYLAAGGIEHNRSTSRRRHRTRGVWQRRFWEHTIRDENDLFRHIDYIHYNPVKHRYATCPHAWPFSSFHRFVSASRYEPDWYCQCQRPQFEPRFASIGSSAGE